MEMSGQFHALANLSPGKKTPVTYRIGGQVSPETSLDRRENRQFEDGESWWQIGKNVRTLFDRPKPTVGCSADGRRGGRRRRRRRRRRI